MTTQVQEHFPSTGDLGSVMSLQGVEPWDWLDKLREIGNVVWDEEPQAWLVASHGALKEFLSDDETFTRPEKVAGAPQVGRFMENVPAGTDPRYWQELITRLTALRGGSKRQVDPVVMDGDEHKHVHRWWVNTFSPRLLERWRATKIRPLLNDQLDQLGDVEAAELVERFVEPVVPRVMSAVTGGHTDERWARELSDVTLKFIATRLVQHQAEVPVELIETAVAAGEKINELLMPIVQAKRGGTDDDLISIVWRDAEELFQPERYGAYDDDDIMSVAVAIGRGGLSTVRSGVTAVLYELMRHPDLHDELRAGGERAVKAFVEETLRLNGPVDVRPRVATRDVVFEGASIREGDAVVGLTLAANRDESYYKNATSLDIHRSALRSHYSFGKGPRSCPGHAFGRMVMADVVEIALERMPGLRIDPDAAPPVYKGLMLRSWEPLNARFTLR